MLELIDIYKTFNAGTVNEKKALQGLSLHLKPGDFVILAARPSVGKTSFAMNIAECVALGRDINGKPFEGENNRPHPVMIFSLEMDTTSLAKRMVCGRAHVSAWRIARNLMTRNEKADATSALMRGNDTITSAVAAQDLASIESIYEAGTPGKWKICNVSGANQRTAGAVIASGSVLLTQLTVNGPNRQNATYDAQLTGYGAYTVGA